MKYENLDPILDRWAKKHGLHISTRYKDAEVRETTVVDDAGNIYQIWCEIDRERIEVGVSAPREKLKRESLECTVDSLEESLEEAYEIVLLWINESGNSRSPVL